MWLASITTNGKTTKLGYFQDEKQAARAYDEEASRLERTACDGDGASSHADVRDEGWYIQG